MKYKYLFFYVVMILLISFVNADVTPPDTMNFRDRYNITNVPYYNGTNINITGKYYGNGSELTGVIGSSNSSDYWDDMDSINATQMENSGGSLNILESWLTTFWNSVFGTKTTDNLTEGSTNLYDNSSWNETHTDTLYAGIEWDYNQTVPAMSYADDLNTSMKTYVDAQDVVFNNSMKTYTDNTFITQADEGNLNVNSSTWWADVSGWVTGWFKKTGNNLDFNETKLNETGDARYVNIDGDTMTGDLNMSDNDITDVGNITASYFIGDGSELTNVGVETATALTVLGKAAENIAKGQPVYISGAVGTNVQFSLTDNTVDGKTSVLGLAAETKTTGQTILIRIGGQLNDFNTTAWSEGDCLYISTSGALTNVTPTSGSIIHVANVENINVNTGSVMLNIRRTRQRGTPVGVDLFTRLGDDVGANKIEFRNYSNSQIAYIDSNGSAWFAGDLEIDGNITSPNFFGNLIGSWNGSSLYILVSNEGNLNVNSSDYWDGLGVPSDLNNLITIQGENISGGTIDFARLPTLTNMLTLDWANITNKFVTAVDNIYIYMSGTTATLNETKLNNSIDARAVTVEADPLWSGNQSSYSTTAEIIAFGYYNSTDFVITDYFTKTQIENFGYYNSTDFSISDYFTSAEVLAFNYYNSTDFSISDYVTSATLSGYNYYNASDFVISDYYTSSQIDGFAYYNLSDFDINDYATNVKVNSLGNWSADKSSYWDTSADLDTVIATDEITELKIDFNTVCAAGNHLYVSGNNLACEADDDTTYTNGTGLSLVGSTFSIILSYFTDKFIELTDSFGGDVSGTYDAIVVKDDSHTHAYQNITNEPWIEDSQLPLANLTSPYCGNITGATSNLCTLVDSDTTYTAEEDLIYLDGTEFKSNKTILNDSIEVFGYIDSYTDTNASTACSGSTTYLDGEGNCDDISGVYAPINYGDDWNKTYADTLYADISVTGDNSSWNETYADTLYADISIDGTVTSVATDDTYLTGGAITTTGTITFNTTLAGTSLAVDSADKWDALNSPSDINAGDITDDGTYRLESWNNLTGIPHATPTNADVTHFSLSDEIYDFVIALSYATTTYVDNLVATYTHLSNYTDDLGDRGYTSNSNFSNDEGYTTNTGTVTSIATTSPLAGGTITSTGTLSLTACADTEIYKYNSTSGAWECESDDGQAYTGGDGITITGSEINHTDTSSQASSDNSGNTFIQDIVLDTFGHITSIVTSGVDFSSYVAIADLVSYVGNWTADKSSYWDTANDLDTVISNDEIAEGKINFTTACAAGNHYYLNGNDLACEADDDTTYTAGNGIALAAGAFSVAGGDGLTQETSGLKVTADGIGDTQLAFNTGQHLTTTSNPTFNNVTVTNCIIGGNGAELCFV